MQLVIQSFGASLHRKQEAFEVVQKGEKTKVSPLKLRSIVLSKGARISSDAVLLAIEHEIEILFTDRGGLPLGRVWSPRFGSVSTIRRKQLSFSQDREGLWWLMREVLLPKMQAQAALLRSLCRDRPAKAEQLEEGAAALLAFAEKAENLKLGDLHQAKQSLRGLEGNASRLYFQNLSFVLPGLYRFERRSRRPARDMFNCCLNYLYGMLYSNVEGALIKAGLDPYLGILHRDDYNRPVLVYDLIEKYRVWADQVLLQLCFRRMLKREMFSVEGTPEAYWLEDSGKRLVIPAMNDYLEEVVQLNQKRRSRLVHLQDDAHRLAQYLLDEDERAAR